MPAWGVFPPKSLRKCLEDQDCPRAQQAAPRKSLLRATIAYHGHDGIRAVHALHDTRRVNA